MPLTSLEKALLGKKGLGCHRCSRQQVGRARQCCTGPEVLRVAAMNKDGCREGRAEKPPLPRGQASPIDLGDILLHLLEGHIQLGEQLQVRILDLAVFLFEQEAQAPVLLATD